MVYLKLILNFPFLGPSSKLVRKDPTPEDLAPQAHISEIGNVDNEEVVNIEDDYQKPPTLERYAEEF